MGWVKQAEDFNMPDWLKQYLNEKCEMCGADKENFYNEKGECTNRRCSNNKCPGTLAHRIADMCEFLKIGGIKEGKGLQMVKEHSMSSHYEAIPYIFSKKPEISLSEFMRISFIPGIDSQWETICGDSTSIDELINRCDSKYKYLIQLHRKELDYGIQFVEIKKIKKPKYRTLIFGNVMISGNIRGYTVREDFIRDLNCAAQGLLNLRVVGKRKTDVMCLIQEADEPYRGKAECALENNIPILTPEEFKEKIRKDLNNKLESLK